MKHFPLWLKLSFLHSAVSVLLTLAWASSLVAYSLKTVGYLSAMLVFLLNFPGMGVLMVVLGEQPGGILWCSLPGYIV